MEITVNASLEEASRMGRFRAMRLPMIVGVVAVLIVLALSAPE
jgi:hypothetical protein